MQFITPDFLLTNKTAQRLFHEEAEQLPIIDYHCHLEAKEIARDASFGNITNIWLDNDHYKWTAMRWNGVPEREITGDAPDRDKFLAYAKTLPQCIGNPLHHWSHLELCRFFGYSGHLTGETAPQVWELANSALGPNGLTARQCLAQSRVELLCTTDDPADPLDGHKALAAAPCTARVLPAMRPDRVLEIGQPGFLPYLQTLGSAAGLPVTDLESLLEALRRRMDAFAALGCRLADHGLERVVWQPCTQQRAAALLHKRLEKQPLEPDEENAYKTFLLCWFARQYTMRDWAMQLHFGVLRNISPRLCRTLGVDAGGDAMAADTGIDALAPLLGALQEKEALPRTILYSIQPADNAAIDTIAGCFADGSARGRVQHGCAWWFNDTKIGMEAHLQTLASLSALGSFIGMLTDSRSFLSYPRHEYFRRILCNYFGTLVERGEYPNDPLLLRGLVRGICYENAKQWFAF